MKRMPSGSVSSSALRRLQIMALTPIFGHLLSCNRSFKLVVLSLLVSPPFAVPCISMDFPLVFLQSSHKKKIRRKFNVFLKETWKEVEAEAAIGAEVLFIDEASFQASHAKGTTWGNVNERPVVEVSGSRPRVSAISATTWNGDFYGETYTGPMNAGRFCQFLVELMTLFPGRLVVLVDGLRVHMCKEVREWVDQNGGGRIRLVKFPKYSPELNPDESMWSWIKGELNKIPLKKGEIWREKVDDMLLRLSEAPNIVHRLFQHPALRYLQRAVQEYSHLPQVSSTS